MNTRANIMYFIEHFLEMAQKDGHVDYVRMIQRDIIRVVDAVAPDDGSGAANVKVVRRVCNPSRTGSHARRDNLPHVTLHTKNTFAGPPRPPVQSLPPTADRHRD